MCIRILVVEDNELTRNLVASALSEGGHDAETAPDGKTALELCHQGHFDIIILDMKLPDMDGIDVLKEARRISPDSYIVILTAFATIDTAVESIKRGAYDYMRKPFTKEQLLSLISRIKDELKIRNGTEEITLLKDYGPGQEDSFRIFRSLAQETSGLCISKQNPAFLRKKYDFGKGTELVWLDGKVPVERLLDPRNLYDVRKTILDFLHLHDDGVVMFDGIEYLINLYDWEIIDPFLSEISEELFLRNARMLINIETDIIRKGDIDHLRESVASMNFKVLDILSNPIRIDIIRYLAAEEGADFISIQRHVGVADSSLLSFHLKKLVAHKVIAKEERTYVLLRNGRIAAKILTDLARMRFEGFQSVVALTYDEEEHLALGAGGEAGV